jgi:GDP-L-fucose synthase
MEVWTNKKVLLTGGDGFLGKAVRKKLLAAGVKDENIIIPYYPEHNLTQFSHCLDFTENINIVIHLAAKVGGILFNKKHPGSMMYDNLLMGAFLLEASRINRVEKVVLFGTTCSYPEDAPLPFREEDLWKGYPAPVTAPYGIAKKTIHEMAIGYQKEYGLNSIFLLPVNLYGPEDNFIKEDAHVIPALIQRFDDAVENDSPEVVVWGSGTATREFLYIDDAAEAVLLAAEKHNHPEAVNLGTGIETPVKDIVEMIAELTGFTGNIVWDKSKPDGTPRRCLNVEKAEKLFGFKAKTNLKDGLASTIKWYREYKHLL